GDGAGGVGVDSEEGSSDVSWCSVAVWRSRNAFRRRTVVVDDEIQKGRDQIIQLLEELEADRGIDGNLLAIQWNEPMIGDDHKLTIEANGQQKSVIFSYDEVADCFSGGPDGREIRQRITRRLAQAVDSVLGNRCTSSPTDGKRTARDG